MLGSMIGLLRCLSVSSVAAGTLAGAVVWEARQLHVELGDDGRLRSVMFQVDGTEYVAAGDA